MASSRASAPLSKGQQTSMTVAELLSMIMMSGRRVEPDSSTTLSVEIVPERVALTKRSTMALWRVVMDGMLVGQWHRMCGRVSASGQ